MTNGNPKQIQEKLIEEYIKIILHNYQGGFSNSAKFNNSKHGQSTLF